MTSKSETCKETADKLNVQKCDKESQQVANDKPKLLERLALAIPGFGILVAFLSCFFYVTTFLMVKWTPNVHSIVLLTIRCFMQTFVYGIPILVQRKPFLGSLSLNTMLVLRGVFAYLCGWLYYASLRLIPFGDATSIAQSAPIYTSIIAYFLLGESFSWLQVLCLCFSLTGVGLIAKPQLILELITGRLEGNLALHADSLRGTCFAFFSAIFLAICYVIVRKLQRASVMLVLFWFSMGSFICGSVHLIWLKFYLNEQSARWPNTTEEWTFTMISALGGLIGQYLVNLALKIEEAGPVSLVRTGDILLSFILQALILHNEPIELSSLLGAFIIFLAITLATLKKWVSDGRNPPKILIWIFRVKRKEQTKQVPLSNNGVVRVLYPEPVSESNRH